MTRDEIIKLASQAIDGTRSEVDLPVPFVLRFAALVAAAEREACAQIVQSECIGFTPEDDQINCIVAAIRARSIQPPKSED